MPKASGQLLYELIFNRYKRLRTHGKSWVTAMADDMRIEILRFDELLLKSSSLMFLRRIIRNARWYKETFSGESDREIRKRFEKEYLANVFAFDPDTRADVSRLAFQAVAVSMRNVAPNLRQRLLENAQAQNAKCEICGCKIDFQATDGARFTLDHIWPQSLGGESEEWNLRVACADCNSRRGDIVDESDIHYEHFHIRRGFVQASASEKVEFEKEFRFAYEIAALVQSEFQCAQCHKPVRLMTDGPRYGRLNRNENYNLFNIRVLCSSCTRNGKFDC